MKKELTDNVSLFVKVFGDIFLILGLFAGIAYLMMAILFNVKDVYQHHDYFGLAEIIIFGTLFLLTTIGSIAVILLNKKELFPYAFMVTSLISFALLMYVFFVILAKMKIGNNESFFTTVKFAFTFFLLGQCTIVVLGSMMPFLLTIRGYFNSLIHCVAYIVEAIVWVVLFILMITMVSPTSGFLIMAFLFLRTGVYWWLLATKRDLRKIFKVKTKK